MKLETPDYMNEKQFVLDKYPDAWVNDDGTSVGICLPKNIDTPCETCHRPWKRTVQTTTGRCLGSAGSEPYAWIKAAQALGYQNVDKATA